MGNSRKEADDFKEMFLLLLKHGADPNIKYGHKYAPDNTKILLNELAAGISCITKENAQFSEILNKEISRKVEIAELLISFGANVNARDPNGNTPLHIAAEKNGIPMIKILVSHGADLKETNKSSETPLHYSIIHGGGDLSCQLHTIETLCSLEANLGGKLDWAAIREVANKPSVRGKEQIIALIDQLEKNPSAMSQDKSPDKVISKAIDDTYTSQKDKLSSNDPKVVAAATKAHARLKGTWIVDPEATKEFLKNNTLSSKDRELFGLSSPFLIGIVFEFKDEVVTSGTQNGDKKFTYYILPQQNGEMKYLSEKTQRSEVDILTVSIVNGKNLKISPLRKNGLDFFLWKRANLDPDAQAKGVVADHTMEFWKEWYQDIELIFKGDEKPAVSQKH